jgi:hypothetical protein
MTLKGLSLAWSIWIPSEKMRRFRSLPVLLFAFLLIGVPAATATSYGGSLQRDFIREEVLRLINGERALRGFKPVKLDTFLAAKAHDSAVRCPNDAKRLNQGRAQSLAAQNTVPPTHALPKCKSYTVLSVVPYWNYSSGRGEILTLNNQDFSRVRYDFGCPMGSQQACGKSNYTYTANTAAQAMRQWMNSSGHRGIILGSYSRAGCGVWQGGTAYYGGYAFTNARWYACIFASVGPTANNDTAAPALSNVTVNGSPYTAGMSVGSSATVRFTLTDLGGPSPRVSDWWSYLDGNDSRGRTGFREGAFDAAGSTVDVSFSVDLSSLAAGSHTLTLVGRGMDTRQTALTLNLVLAR